MVLLVTGKVFSKIEVGVLVAPQNLDAVLDMDTDHLKCVLLYNFSRKQSKNAKRNPAYMYKFYIIHYSVLVILYLDLQQVIPALKDDASSGIVLHLIVQ